MMAFLSGVVIALVVTAVNSLYDIFHTKLLFVRLRKLIFWLPANLTVACGAGFIVQLIQSDDNEILTGLALVLSFFVNVSCSFVLEYHLSFLHEPWQECDEAKLRDYATKFRGPDLWRNSW